nr:MAG: hypothetical protein [Bacteriophage sp.]
MANKFKTLPIGTIFTYNGNKYKVCKDDDCYYTCNRCAFNGTNCDTIKGIRGNCIFGYRTDHAQIYYIQINDETMNKDSDNSSIITPTFNTDNSLNDLHIDCPKGYSIDVEHSDLSKGIIKFKKNDITYKDIEDALNLEKELTGVACNVNNLAKLSAIDKLINIANYYNKGWKPDFNNKLTHKYIIQYNGIENKYTHYSVDYDVCINRCCVYFKNQEDAQAVIDNPNFRDILDTIYKG